MKDVDSITKERLRVKAEYERRDLEIDKDLYAPWQPGEILMTSERKRVAAAMLQRLQKFPKAGDRCLEIGYGKLGWLSDLISWGLRETDLYGIELDETRAATALEALPSAHLEIGDATKLSWPDDFFRFVIVSTVFSSILDRNVRNMIAEEIKRVLMPGGVVIWYDIAINNPGNQSVKGITRNEIKTMFPAFSAGFKSVTLAPPIARAVSKHSWAIATILSAMPLFRTHTLGMLVKI